MRSVSPEASSSTSDPRDQRGLTALYRLYAADGTPLYFGISNDPDRRFKQHRDSKPWWPQVAHDTIEWYPSRDRALAAESTAIKAETPAYNLDHNPIALHNPPSLHWPPIGMPADRIARTEHAAEIFSSDEAERFLRVAAWDFSLAQRDAAMLAAARSKAEVTA
ncbi:hypothetical protein QBA54_31780 [Streptomyces sp. B21-108]|uniref:GIY-YIG nuclease family protein n=1 Tax=Streptomyces sp. B21-108 TaxID=3039419 RepID=UPI002FF191FD